MLNFFLCFVALISLAFGFKVLWGALISPVNKHFVLNNTPTGPLQVAWLLLQLYIVAGWAAICVAMVRLFIAQPNVTLSLPYYVLAFFLCVLPLYDPVPGQSNTMAYYALICFATFVFVPGFIGPWWWFLQVAYLPAAIWIKVLMILAGTLVVAVAVRFWQMRRRS